MRYRKKPVVVEAEPYIPGHRPPAGVVMHTPPDGGEPYPACITVEGPLRVSPGDMIIRGVKGEFYPCKPDIFEMTYEPVPDDFGADEIREVFGR